MLNKEAKALVRDGVEVKMSKRGGTFVTLREVVDEVAALEADLGVVVAFGQILPTALLDAIPGGYVFVNRGLIERATAMDQVAGVLGHEIGHVTRRHSIKQMQKAQGANVGVTLACVLTGVCNNGLASAGIQIAANAIEPRQQALAVVEVRLLHLELQVLEQRVGAHREERVVGAADAPGRDVVLLHVVELERAGRVVELQVRADRLGHDHGVRGHPGLRAHRAERAG